jgi:hypothetical protein
MYKWICQYFDNGRVQEKGNINKITMMEQGVAHKY